MPIEIPEHHAVVFPTYPDLAGRVAVVTGGSGGIGAATCRALAANGAKVAVHGRDEAKIAAVVSDIHVQGGQALGVAADVSDFAAIERMRQQVERTLGPAEVLAVFAASGGPPPSPLAQITEEGWRAAIDGNLTTAFLTLKSFLPRMKELRRGTIITISSAAARRAHAQSPIAYSAAKSGVQMLTQHLAAQVGPFGIRVNGIAPETILTERNHERIPASVQTMLIGEHPVRRLGTPEDVANAALFLASEASGWMSGVILDVAGGAVMA